MAQPSAHVVLFVCMVFLQTSQQQLLPQPFPHQTASIRYAPRNSDLPAEFGQKYWQQVSTQSPMVFHFQRRPGSDNALEVKIDSFEATIEEPIIVIVKRKSAVITWQLPLIVEQNYVYPYSSRILCPSKYYQNSATFDTPDEMFIEILTLTSRPTRFSFQVDILPNFEIAGLQTLTVQAAPFAPKYAMYTMRPGASRTLVKFKSTGNNLCAYFSVQNVACPVGDLTASMRLSGRYQSVMSQGAIDVRRQSFPDGKFYVVVLVKPDDLDCQSPQSLHNLIRPRTALDTTFGDLRQKSVNLTFSDDVDTASSIALAISVPIVVFVVFALLCVILLQTGFRNWKAILCGDLANVHLPTKGRQWRLMSIGEKSVTGKDVPYIWDPANYRHVVAIIHTNQLAQTSPIEPQMTFPFSAASTTEDETAVDSVARLQQARVPPNKTAIRRKVDYVVSDIQRKTSAKITKVAKEYSLSLITVFIFYSLPVLQLVMTHQALLFVTGNEDLCFYNFSCANRVGVLSDFNHILSNLGYMILGLLFLLIVRRRSVYFSKLKTRVQNLDHYGIPNQFGLYYGMGLALVMEGVMSSCYHVCPSYNNFQFDTSFMYLLSGLLIVKLYHARHPDALPRSYLAYGIFAGFILISVIGVVTKGTVYWILFSVAHGLLAVSIGMQLLFVGYVEFRPREFYKAGRKFTFARKGDNVVPLSRIVLATLITLINLYFAITGPLLKSTDFASHLLFILQANLGIYAVFYIGMKITSRSEKITWMTLLYFVLATVAWVIGMWFFTRGLTNWEVSAAMSREGNVDCFFLNFYDEHDVWHMCSALGLFFTFMMLLILDDDLATVKHQDIPVF